MYRSLDAEKIILTVKTLSQRIDERFPGSGLNAVCNELHLSRKIWQKISILNAAQSQPHV